MSFIRPEARALFWRWREVMIGAGVIVLGLYWAFFVSPGLLTWVGYAALGAGLVLGIAGIQRGRFRQSGGGPGVVQIVERQIGYFGPLDGGVVDLDAVNTLRLDASQHPAHWIIAHDTGAPLHIPITAEGADGLFDAFASLPGLAPSRLTEAVRTTGRIDVVVWRRADVQARTLSLH